MSATPNRASSASAAKRPYSLAVTAQLPPTAASVATSGEGRGHAGQHGEAALDEGAIGAREYEREHRQDAGAQDGQYAAEISQNEQEHRATMVAGSGGVARDTAGTATLLHGQALVGKHRVAPLSTIA